MRATLFTLMILQVAIQLWTKSSGLQAAHEDDDGPPLSETDSKRQPMWYYKLLQYQTSNVVVDLCALFTIDLAVLAILYYFDLLPSSYRTMISVPTKDAARPDDEGAKKNDRPIRTTGKYDEGLCSICYNSPQIDKSFPPCEHTYCFDCLVRWCKIQKVCPTCNGRIPFFDHKDGNMRCYPNQLELRWKTVLKHHYSDALITSGRQAPFILGFFEWHIIMLSLISLDTMVKILFYCLIENEFI